MLEDIGLALSYVITWIEMVISAAHEWSTMLYVDKFLVFTMAIVVPNRLANIIAALIPTILFVWRIVKRI